MKTIATINFKGGVGKTTITWCLGDVLSQREGSNILLFDLDAQASLTQSIEFGQRRDEFTLWKKNSEEQKNTIHAALNQFLHQTGEFKFQPDENFIYQINSKYHFVPAMNDLYWVGLDSFDPERGRVFIRRILEKIVNSSKFPDYDYVIFDCPPSFTPLSYSVLTCCDLVLIPVNPDFFAVKGVDLLMKGCKTASKSTRSLKLRFLLIVCRRRGRILGLNRHIKHILGWQKSESLVKRRTKYRVLMCVS
ncbi:ParA family protein [Candidatus Spongiihabitans sp.]|uniref:ParA family protein n=1 Tax=Candidatus Spongiihabitans sp. TaxID=3101308 RepID=UPI003C7CFD87